MNLSKYFEKDEQELITEDDLQEIFNILEDASNKYYNTDVKIMSDTEFDNLKDLYEQYREFPVGAMPVKKGKGLANIRHEFKGLVGTLLKANTLEELQVFIDDMFSQGISKPIIKVSYKYDGNSVAFEYDEKGNMKKALTRGRNGQGVDLTHIFKNHPAYKKLKHIPYNKPFGIQCEVLMTYPDFEKYKDMRESDYKNPRNTVAGLLGSDDAAKYVDFLTPVPLNVKFLDTDITNSMILETFIEDNFSSNINSKVNFIEYKKYLSGSTKEIMRDITKIYNDLIVSRTELDFLIDGIVVEFMNPEYEEMGYVGSESSKPRWKIALKFPYMEKTSIVTKFDFPTGITGRITPRVWFKPVSFLGNTCEKVSLASAKRFEELKLGIGSEVLVEYRNDVLSYVNPLSTENNLKIKPYPFPTHCEECGSPIEYTETKALAFCSNDMCPAKVTGRVQRYLEKLGIKGVKYATLLQIHTNDLLNNIPDFYKLTKRQLTGKCGFGSVQADNIIKAINEARNPFDYQVLAGIGISDFGEHLSKTIMKELTLEELMMMKYESYENEKIEGKMYKMISSLEGFSDIMTSRLIEGLDIYYEEIAELLNTLEVKEYKRTISKPKGGNTMIIVFTGFRDSNLQTELELKGHKVTGSVSGKTNYVVTKDPHDNTVKLQKARELGIKIVTPEELRSELL